MLSNDKNFYDDIKYAFSDGQDSRYKVFMKLCVREADCTPVTTKDDYSLDNNKELLQLMMESNYNSPVISGDDAFSHELVDFMKMVGVWHNTIDVEKTLWEYNDYHFINEYFYLGAPVPFDVSTDQNNAVLDNYMANYGGALPFPLNIDFFIAKHNDVELANYAAKKIDVLKDKMLIEHFKNSTLQIDPISKGKPKIFYDNVYKKWDSLCYRTRQFYKRFFDLIKINHNPHVMGSDFVETIKEDSYTKSINSSDIKSYFIRVRRTKEYDSNLSTIYEPVLTPQLPLFMNLIPYVDVNRFNHYIYIHDNVAVNPLRINYFAPTILHEVYNIARIRIPTTEYKDFLASLIDVNHINMNDYDNLNKYPSFAFNFQSFLRNLYNDDEMNECSPQEELNATGIFRIQYCPKKEQFYIINNGSRIYFEKYDYPVDPYCSELGFDVNDVAECIRFLSDCICKGDFKNLYCDTILKNQSFFVSSIEEMHKYINPEMALKVLKKLDFRMNVVSPEGLRKCEPVSAWITRTTATNNIQRNVHDAFLQYLNLLVSFVNYYPVILNNHIKKTTYPHHYGGSKPKQSNLSAPELDILQNNIKNNCIGPSKSIGSSFSGYNFRQYGGYHNYDGHKFLSGLVQMTYTHLNSKGVKINQNFIDHIKDLLDKIKLNETEIVKYIKLLNMKKLLGEVFNDNKAYQEAMKDIDINTIDDIECKYNEAVNRSQANSSHLLQYINSYPFLI